MTMTAWPVIERELRAAARHPFTYWIRVLGASALLVVFATMMMDQPGNAPTLGAELFGNLNTALFAAIWLLGPSLTADCISRERRDGTLGFLFLTPLTAQSVVIGKSLIHGLRAMSMMLAALPVLAVAFLLGGVNWREGVLALFLNLSSVCLALAAGLAASCRTQQWNRALLLAEVIAAALLALISAIYCFGMLMQVAVPYVPGISWDAVEFEEFIEGMFLLFTNAGGAWSQGLSAIPSPAAGRSWIWVTGEILLLSMLILALVVCVVARRVGKTWQEKPPTARRHWWRQLLLKPLIWRAFFRHRMRRRLDRNPIGWLQQYSTLSRVTKWGWFLFVVLVESCMVAWAGWSGLDECQFWVVLLVLLGLAASAAGSFRREREAGTLELILVTPLSVGQIIFGRLRGVWGQFLPTIALLLLLFALLAESGIPGSWSYGWPWRFDENTAFGLLVALSFLTIPVLGLYCSLVRKSFLSAWISTALAGLVLPWLIAYFVPGIIWSLLRESLTYRHYGRLLSGGAQWLLMSGACLQLLFAATTAGLLFRNLRRRKFAFA